MFLRSAVLSATQSVIDFTSPHLPISEPAMIQILRAIKREVEKQQECRTLRLMVGGNF
jgi:hypothetical protein